MAARRGVQREIMILFQEQFVEPILSGRKTVTRRRGKMRWREGSIHKCYTKPPFAKGGSEPFAQVRVRYVRLQRLYEMGEGDAQLEGVKDLRHFFRGWYEMHGTIDIDEEVWVVYFELVEETQS